MALNLSNKRLTSILDRAFDAGVNGCAEEKDGVVMALIAEARSETGKFRYYTMAELRRLQHGRKIVHALKGDGEVVVSEKIYGVRFADGFLVSFGPSNSSFWACPIMDVGSGAAWSSFSNQQG